MRKGKLMQWAFLAKLGVSGEPRRKVEESLLVREEKRRRLLMQRHDT